MAEKAPPGPAKPSPTPWPASESDAVWYALAKLVYRHAWLNYRLHPESIQISFRGEGPNAVLPLPPLEFLQEILP